MTVVVIDQNPNSTYAGRKKNKEKFGMHSLKSFKPDGMDKQTEFIKKKS